MTRPRSVPSEAVVTLISAAEDLGAFLGSVLVLAVPYSGYAAVGITGFIYWRVRGRRRSKYKKMRRTAAVRAAAVDAERLEAQEPEAPPAPAADTPPASPESAAFEAGALSPAGPVDEPVSRASGGDADGR